MSAPSLSPRQEAWRRLRRDRLAIVSLALVVLYVAAALLAQLLELSQGAPFLYEMTLREQGLDFPEGATPPSLDHWQSLFGTTGAGKSVLVRVFHGTKVAMVVGLFGASLSVFIGGSLGLMAGYFGGWVDELVQYLYTTLASIPYLLLMLALAFVIRQGPVAETYHQLAISEYLSLGLFNIVLVIGMTSWVTLCRLVRAETKKVRELEYIQAARALGMPSSRVLLVHVLPNVAHLMLINFSLSFVIGIKSEVILTFLGVGVDREPSWGQMIADARSELMQGVWWPLLAAGLALFVLTLAVNFIGDALRDALDPKLRQ